MTDPEQVYAHAGIGIALWKKGDVLQELGKDPTSTLQLSREAFKKALKIDNKTVITYAYYAEVGLVAARYAISKHNHLNCFLMNLQQIVKPVFQ